MSATTSERPSAAIVKQALSTCAFCGKERREVKALVESADSGARICNECMGLCHDMMRKAGAL